MPKAVSKIKADADDFERRLREMNAVLIKALMREQDMAALADKADQLLREQLADLERFNRAAVGREERMIELKKEINALAVQLGENERYRTDFDSEQ